MYKDYSQNTYENTAEGIKNGVIDFLDGCGFTFYAYEIEQGFMTAQYALRLSQDQSFMFPDEGWRLAAGIWLDRAEYFEI